MVKVEGIQELVAKLQYMQEIPNKVGNKLLRQAGDHVKEVEVETAKKTHHLYSKDVGWQEIKRLPIRSYRSGNKYIDIGVRDRGGDWDKIKGLVFNNYGFRHNLTGRYIAGSNWIRTAYDDSSEQAYRIIREGLLKELKL